jgi:hypothetical protein
MGSCFWQALKLRKAACAIIKETMGDRNSRYYMVLQVFEQAHLMIVLQLE